MIQHKENWRQNPTLIERLTMQWVVMLSVEQWLTFVVTIITAQYQDSSDAIAAPSYPSLVLTLTQDGCALLQFRGWWDEWGPSQLSTLMMPHCWLPTAWRLLVVVAWCLGDLPGYQTSLVTIKKMLCAKITELFFNPHTRFNSSLKYWLMFGSYD